MFTEPSGKPDGNQSVDPLPDSSGEFWKEAKTERIKLGPSITCERKAHEFIRKGREAKCKKCPMGFVLSGQEEVKEGHIYLEDQFLI